MSLSIRILTPLGEYLSATTEMCTLPGLEGEFGVLASHIPLMSALSVGHATLSNGQQDRHFAVGSGYAEVYQDHVTIFVETAEESHEINIERAQQALQRSQKAKQEAEASGADLEYKQAVLAEKRAEVRLAVSKLRD